MTTTKKKPPTQTAGVSGIAPKPIELTPAQPQQIDWRRLCELPPFQMFVVEREPKLAEQFANDNYQAVREWLVRHVMEDLSQQYCAWHAAKGYWPNETPAGELI